MLTKMSKKQSCSLLYALQLCRRQFYMVFYQLSMTCVQTKRILDAFSIWSIHMCENIIFDRSNSHKKYVGIHKICGE